MHSGGNTRGSVMSAVKLLTHTGEIEMSRDTA